MWNEECECAIWMWAVGMNLGLYGIGVEWMNLLQLLFFLTQQIGAGF
jgi:hypothetical protein